MKKKTGKALKWLLPATGILVAGFYLLWLQKQPVTEQLLIRASIFDLSGQLTRPEEWNNWYPGTTSKQPLQETGPDSWQSVSGWRYHWKLINPVSIDILEDSGNTSFTHHIRLMAANKGFYTSISWQIEHQLFSRQKAKDKLDHALAALRNRMENPVQRYGFPIQLVPVSDTLILTIEQKTTLNREAAVQQQLIQRLLEQYPKTMQQIDRILISRTPIGSDSISLSAGIPLTHSTEVVNGMRLLKIPASGRLLLGKGRPDSRTALLNAMNQYLRDQGLKKAADPYAVYRFADSASVKSYAPEFVEWVFPVY